MAVDLVNPVARNVDLALLHPTVRGAVEAVLAQLAAESIPLFVFEAFRSPVRQQHLFAQGRTDPGNIVTHQDAWGSYHQYGLAVDLVFNGPGKWSWEEPSRGMWDRMHAIAADHGLERLGFETPHIQIVNTSSANLRTGRYPAGGDEVWAENLAGAIAAWNGTPPAPPMPAIAERPALAQR
jgi:peptidoglycan L-alanyl-D-glutamate endopeptidase CwlK